jgi:hypothetical protein
MKALFFLLLTINIAFFMWEYKSGGLLPRPEKAPLPSVAIVEPIVLARELADTTPLSVTDKLVMAMPIPNYPELLIPLGLPEQPRRQALVPMPKKVLQ